MAQFDKETFETVRRLQRVRLKLLLSQPFYAQLLMHMKFALDYRTETAYTDGERIAFNPAFLSLLTDRNLQFVLMHEIMHVALGHVWREHEDWNHLKANMAADIVVNSNILKSVDGDISFITIAGDGPAMHTVPGGTEGYLYSYEEVYHLLPDQPVESLKGAGNRRLIQGPENSGFDDHTFWPQTDLDNEQMQVWLGRMIDATEVIKSMRRFSSKGGSGRGLLPLGVERLIEQYTRPQIDWRMMLNDFIQQEINDYSFTPPDRRYGESEFFLPDFNETIDRVDNILFEIDTSGSVGDREIVQAFSEIRGAIDQFGGRLKGWLGFFDARAYQPEPFESIEDLAAIRPRGGGGTDFKCVFRRVRESMKDNPPASIIILTDGFAPFPKENEAMGIPVLWLINNESITAPWGKVARIKPDGKEKT